MTSRTAFVVEIFLFTTLAVGMVSFARAQEPFQKERLIIEKPDGARYEFEVELAVTPQQRGQGLMYRRELEADAGMLFLYTDEDYRFMWMKNTYLSLDMLFIARDGRVVDLNERTVPLSTETIRSSRPVMAVLELAGGTLSKLGIDIGAQVKHHAFDSDKRLPKVSN